MGFSLEKIKALWADHEAFRIMKFDKFDKYSIEFMDQHETHGDGCIVMTNEQFKKVHWFLLENDEAYRDYHQSKDPSCDRD